MQTPPSDPTVPAPPVVPPAPPKRREVDPMLNTLRQCGDKLAQQRQTEPADAERLAYRRRRIGDLVAFLSLVDGLAQRFFESHKSLRAALELLSRREQ